LEADLAPQAHRLLELLAGRIDPLGVEVDEAQVSQDV